jgi:hypothetical protein
MSARNGLHVLWLGETLLLPHIWPIVDAFARAHPATPITIWVSTSAHEATLARLFGARLLGAEHAAITVARAPLFRDIPGAQAGQNPQLPPKLPMLLALLPQLRRADVVLVAEQTSLWLPKLFGPFCPPFVLTVHGTGTWERGNPNRLTAADRLLIPSPLHIDHNVEQGVPEKKIAVTGYAKAHFTPSKTRQELFPVDQPTLLYTPSWRPARSSWPTWGRSIVDTLKQRTDWNVIIAPHQRLFEKDPEAVAFLTEAATAPHIVIDHESFAMVDGSYTKMADLYIGDTSSQIVEFLATPRACLMLRPHGLEWVEESSGDYWRCGEVVTELDNFNAALDRALGSHADFSSHQSQFAQSALGDVSMKGMAKAVAILAQYCA